MPFSKLGLYPQVLEGVSARVMLNPRNPSARNSDGDGGARLIGCAQTGTGKNAAFARSFPWNAMRGARVVLDDPRLAPGGDGDSDYGRFTNLRMGCCRRRG